MISNNSAFTVYKPRRPALLILDFPHSGTVWPKDFHHGAKLDNCRFTHDMYVDELFGFAPRKQAWPHPDIAMLRANFVRSYLDVNRAVNDMNGDDVAAWPAHLPPLNKKFSGKAKSGLGVIPTVCHRQRLYRHPLSAEAISRRIDDFYYPYRNALADMIEESLAAHGFVWHISCHSMPDEGDLPDFVLGTNFGESCSTHFKDELEAALRANGRSVGLDKPYPGADIIQTYPSINDGDLPYDGVQSIQLEINKRLYMNERNFKKNRQFAYLQDELGAVAARLHTMLAAVRKPAITTALAAE